MYKPPTEGLFNANYLEKRGDESPSFIRAAHRSIIFDDVEIQPTSEKPLYRKSDGLTKREKWMIAGLILLGVICIVFIALFAKAAKGGKKTGEEPRNESKEWIIVASVLSGCFFCGERGRRGAGEDATPDGGKAAGHGGEPDDGPETRGPPRSEREGGRRKGGGTTERHSVDGRERGKGWGHPHGTPGVVTARPEGGDRTNLHSSGVAMRAKTKGTRRRNKAEADSEHGRVDEDRSADRVRSNQQRTCESKVEEAERNHAKTSGQKYVCLNVLRALTGTDTNAKQTDNMQMSVNAKREL
ncbi:hypothetical protein ACROYT_G022394 [Oculina patagonica]